MIHKLTCGRLDLKYDESTNGIALSYKDSLLKTDDSGDFFRIMLDDGVYRELTVKAKDQSSPIVSHKNNELNIEYKNLKAVDGKIYSVGLLLIIKKDKNGFSFNATVKNNDKTVRVNELQYPCFSFSSLFSNQKETDALLVPEGLGRKIENPWTYAKEKCHTEYFAAEYNEISYHQPYAMTYPFPLSMSWFGVQSNGKFLCLARLDERFRTCALNLFNTPRHCDDRVILSVSQYPAVLCGESISVGESHLEVFDNGWRDAAAFYGEWAKKWYKPYDKPDWVKNLSGWERVTLRHQYGEIYYKYTDLFKIWQNCKAAGLDGILIFGWWKGGMDNKYPIYEIDDELGGEKELKKAIADIRADGGRVLLYSQGVLIDTASDYYKGIGKSVARKDIDGNTYKEFYKFSNDGTLLNGFGYKTFASACQASDDWKKHLLEIGKYKLSFNPDCIFYDQVGGHLPKPCFDKTHKHGNRIDDEAVYRRENLDAIHSLLTGEQVAGTENTVDCFSQYFQFHHGHMCGTCFSDEAFPQMFRQTFPEEIVSNRLLHDDRDDMQEQLNYAFVNGLILDVCIYRGRIKILCDLPKYFDAVKKLLAVKRKYSEFFYGGKYELTEDYILPKDVYVGEYHSNGKVGFAVWNNSDKQEKVTLKGNDFFVGAKSTEFFVCEK